MPDIRPLRMKLLPEVKQVLDSILSSAKDIQPTICFTKGRVDNECEERWTVGAYSREQISEMERVGNPVLYSVEGFIVAIPQPELIDELENKIFGLGPNGLVLLDREPGI
jgi:hypothetical protein